MNSLCFPLLVLKESITTELVLSCFHGCCWETFCIFAYCGLVVEIQIHLTAKTKRCSPSNVYQAFQGPKNSLPEFMNFKLFGKTFLVVKIISLDFFWAIHSASEKSANREVGFLLSQGGPEKLSGASLSFCSDTVLWIEHEDLQYQEPPAADFLLVRCD